MVTEKKIYRARQSIGGGVCSGIAEYFKTDPIIIQIITVILTFATGGILAVAYVALWVILPQKPAPEAPVDVQAHEVHSETYGPIEGWQCWQEKSKNNKSQQNRVNEMRYESYAGNAHIPPEPPKGSPIFTQNTMPYSAVAEYSIPPNAATAPYMQNYSDVTRQSVTESKKDEEKQFSGAHVAVVFGFFLFFVGLCVLLEEFVIGVEWWQFWPLFLVIGGIGQMIIPGKRGHCKSRFVHGFMHFAFGVAALPFSLGFVSMVSLIPIFLDLWPILLITCGLLILGAATDIPLFSLLACLSFVVFCVVGIVWFSSPGPTEMITLSLPTGQKYFFSLDVWL